MKATTKAARAIEKLVRSDKYYIDDISEVLYAHFEQANLEDWCEVSNDAEGIIDALDVEVACNIGVVLGLASGVANGGYESACKVIGQIFGYSAEDVGCVLMDVLPTEKPEDITPETFVQWLRWAKSFREDLKACKNSEEIEACGNRDIPAYKAAQERSEGLG